MGDKTHDEVGFGNGPVNAVDTALRKALIEAYPLLSSVELTDYKVRILEPQNGDEGTGAVTRVLIEFKDDSDHIWRTCGVSTNIIDASVMALSDGMRYKLHREKAALPSRH